MARCERSILDYASGEYWLDRYANGGGVIFLRTFQTTALVFGAAVWLHNGVDPSRTVYPSWKEACASISANIAWLGAIAAATYAAFYTRFAAQWSYLATTYNQIKQTEITARAQDPGFDQNRERRRFLAEWKAAFIDDADVLHLATQKSFSSIVVIWARDELVRESFIHGTHIEA